MKKVVINGKLYPENEAKISIFDRGFLFSDSVYEVSAVLEGKLISNDDHLIRLNNSLKELGFKNSIDTRVIQELQNTLISENKMNEGIVYIQVTRGEEQREFLYNDDIEPNIVIFTQEKNIIDNAKVKIGVKIVTTEDIRWKRRDIKTTLLLPQILAKVYAKQQNAFEAWMIDEEGFITEGASSNAFILKNNEIITREPSSDILRGITRNSILEIAREKLNLKIVQRKFTLDEAIDADECFLTSASTFVIPIIQINKTPISSGIPGEISKKLREEYITFVKSNY